MQQAGNIIYDIVVHDNIEREEETKVSLGLKFALVKFKESVNKKSKPH